MIITRLSWAGLQISAEEFTLFIDPLENIAPLAGFLGQPRTELLPIASPPGEAAALVTHIHSDHFDPLILRRLLGSKGYVYGPEAVASKAREEGLAASPVKLEESFTIGPFNVTAVPAMDWRGDDQVSWVVRADDGAIFHGGDTIWHGYWWRVARRHGPFALAFLPINGVIVQMPGLEPSGLPATLTPEQAAIAARLLQARALCPIHYDTFHNPPLYVEHPDAVNAAQTAAEKQGVRLEWARPGESVSLTKADSIDTPGLLA
ncbi:MAG: MBL fold metallo-hydrolase [Chthoniobacterales bacterium]|nr:MBL fold metallo-hydrolase [Chthoniobacterales bacterium]